MVRHVIPNDRTVSNGDEGHATLSSNIQKSSNQNEINNTSSRRIGPKKRCHEKNEIDDSSMPRTSYHHVRTMANPSRCNRVIWMDHGAFSIGNNDVLQVSSYLEMEQMADQILYREVSIVTDRIKYWQQLKKIIQQRVQREHGFTAKSQNEGNNKPLIIPVKRGDAMEDPIPILMIELEQMKRSILVQATRMKRISTLFQHCSRLQEIVRLQETIRRNNVFRQNQSK
jgi:hypothetical protein